MPSMLQAYKTTDIFYLILCVSGVSEHIKELKMLKSRGQDRDPQMLDAIFPPCRLLLLN